MKQTTRKILNNIAEELNITQETLLDIMTEFFITTEGGYTTLRDARVQYLELVKKYPRLMDLVNTQ